MRTRYLVSLAALSVAWCAAAAAQEREPGWDFGADLIYQDSQDIDFTGGSSASLSDDIGIALAFGYRFNERFELKFGLDWNTVDYDVSVANGLGGQSWRGTGDLESFTPRIGVNFNLLKTALTPYISGQVGWTFIDTNIPNGPPVNSCWWDPWWGYVCGTWQSTRSIDEGVYGLGAGVRWDVGYSISLRLGYEKNWIDLSDSTSTPGLDQVRFSVLARY